MELMTKIIPDYGWIEAQKYRERKSSSKSI